MAVRAIMTPITLETLSQSLQWHFLKKRIYCRFTSTISVICDTYETTK